ncbi:putative nucleotidyltransferase substrate binding domain-containing protein, partial [Burkholderia mallei]|uniref:putative nucleotidyltransferase substrate binding domain-containing protein n=1 Tax=Burkholderia mallei TaxID=13373 RepID=UPI0034D37013
GSNFINRFALPGVQIGNTASFWQKFTGGADSDIDLKKAGIFPIVHGTRALALEFGITETSTKARLNALVKRGA